jgi:class 3 adenylate cyclase/tetratricopeptide (TPR) repeat protein
MLLSFGWHKVYGQDIPSDTTGLRREQYKVDSLVLLADDNFKSGSMENALSLAGQAYSSASRIDYHEGMGDALMVMGRIDQVKGRSGQALRNFFTAMREYEWMGTAGKQSIAARTSADVFHSAGLYEKALEYYLLALDRGRDNMSEGELASLRELIARTYLELSRHDQALKIYLDLYEQYRVSGNEPLQISALNQITLCLVEQKSFEEAGQYNLQALELSRKSGNKALEMAVLNNLGYTSKQLKRHSAALDYFRLAADLGISINAPVEEITVVLTNMAVIYQNDNKFGQSLNHFFMAEKLAVKAGNMKETARIGHLIASTYYIMGDYYNAGIYTKKALGLALEAGDAELASMAYLLSSNIAAALYDYETSMQEYRRFLSIKDSLALAGQFERQDLSQQKYMVEKTEKELDEMIYTRQLERVELSKLRLESDKKEQELELLQKTADLQEATILNQELEKNRAMQELLLAEERLAMERKDREIKDLKVQQQLQESELRRAELEQIRQNQEIQVLTQQNEIAELNLQKVRIRNMFLAGVIALSMVILVIIIRSWRYARKINRILFDQRNKIQQQKEAIESQYDLIKIEREKSEKLLLNILPEETAAELKEKGYASPRQYGMVTVLFTDFVGFTMVAEKMTPEEIIRELDYCFLEFDRIIDRHNLEKIKTIGDSYMCAGGIPLANETNPFDVVAAAIEIRDFMDATKKAREADGEEYWQLRIGVHTGRIIAGVVGKNKFAYDIWGDAVNTASRMESSGEAGKVNISGSTYEIIKDHYTCSYRGKVKAKNKGEVDMYFVESPTLPNS